MRRAVWAGLSTIAGRRQATTSQTHGTAGPFAVVALVALLVLGAVRASADPFTLLFFLSYASIGALLVRRRPGNVVSWLLLAIGFSFILTTIPADLDRAALEAGTESTRDFLISWCAAWGGSAGYVSFLALSLLFPAGNLPTGRWRYPAGALIAAGFVLTVLAAAAPTISFSPDGGLTSIVVPNRLAILPDLPIWSTVPTDGTMIIPIIVFLAFGAGSLFVRYLRATGILRLQLRWLVATFSFTVVAVVFGLGSWGLFGAEIGILAWIPAIVAYPTIPAAIAVAILRYRLYEIDRIISRTISYGVVSATLVAVYAGLVLVLQGPLGTITGGDTVAVAASTLAAAALFQPVRRRTQTAVDHRFNRARYDAERTIDALATRLRDEMDLPIVRSAVVDAVARSVEPTATSLWLRPGRAR